MRSLFASMMLCSVLAVFGCSTVTSSRGGNGDCGNDESCGNESGKNRGGGEIKGRDIVDSGKPITVTGKLKAKGEEWAIVCDGKSYDIHFGRKSYREEQGVKLVDGATATIKGVELKGNITCFTLTTNGKTTKFRDKDGHPMWGGRGRHGGK